MHLERTLASVSRQVGVAATKTKYSDDGPWPPAEPPPPGQVNRGAVLRAR